MEGRTIDVTVVSATDLKKVKKFGQSQKCYAVAHVYPAVKKKTELDNYGGVNPNWNAKLSLNCYEAHLHSGTYAIVVEIFCKHSPLGNDKLVGTASLPLGDIPIGNGEAKTDLFETALDVLRPSGEVQGALNLSVVVGAMRVLSPYEDPSAPRMSAMSSEQQQEASGSSRTPASPTAPPISPKTSTTHSKSTPARSKRNLFKAAPSKLSSHSNAASTSNNAAPSNLENHSNSASTSNYASHSSFGNNVISASSSNYASPSIAAPYAQDLVVTGYPVTGYPLFDPLGQVPMQRNEHPYVPDEHPYVPDGNPYVQAPSPAEGVFVPRQGRGGGRQNRTNLSTSTQLAVAARRGPAHLGIAVIGIVVGMLALLP